MRVFVACHLDVHARGELYSALAPLRVTYSGQHFRWVAADNYHLTLRFFGDVSADVAAEIGSMIETIATAETPFECETNAPLPLPNARRPNVVVLPIESNGRLERLTRSCNDGFVERFGAPDQPFRAHLTVIRCRPGARFRPFDGGFRLRFVVARMGLYDSKRLADGVRYTALSEFEFRARAASAASGEPPSTTPSVYP